LEKEETLDFKTITKILHSGIVVHVVQVEKIKEEKNYVLATLRLMIKTDACPVFGDVKLKMSKQAITTLQREAGRCSGNSKKKDYDDDID
jgi:hypothetical protein